MKFLHNKIVLTIARIVFNIAVWLFLLFGALANSVTYTEAHKEIDELDFAGAAMLYNAFFVVAVYVNTLVLMPALLYRKKYAIYFLSCFVWLLLITALQGYFLSNLLQQYPGIDVFNLTSVALALGHAGEWWGNFLFISLPSVLLFLIISSVWRLVIQLLKVNRQHELIKQQQIEAELTQLKAQINPHFLFNVLNSLYSLSLQKSEHTPETILKLSDILRYMLYDTSAPFVSIDKELSMLQDYIALEQTRVGTIANIGIIIETDNQPYNIAPALLIVFVENAIKHGIDSLSKVAFLHVAIKIQEGNLLFTCRNNYKQKNVPATNGGIGLANITKRLNLLYAKRHELKINDIGQIFEVSLAINLR